MFSSQVFCCEFYDTFKKGHFHEHLWTTAFNTCLTVFLIQFDKYDIKNLKGLTSYLRRFILKALEHQVLF